MEHDGTTLRRKLVEAEQQLATIPDLHVRIAELEADLDRTSVQVAAQHAHIDQVESRLVTLRDQNLAMQQSTSWRITEPLRRAARRRRLRG